MSTGGAGMDWEAPRWPTASLDLWVHSSYSNESNLLWKQRKTDWVEVGWLDEWSCMIQQENIKSFIASCAFAPAEEGLSLPLCLSRLFCLMTKIIHQIWGQDTTRKNSLHFGADTNNWDGPQIFLICNFLSNNSRILINSGHILRSGIYVFWTLSFESKS